MWIHILIFIILAGFWIAWKCGWISAEIWNDASSRKWFLAVAFLGNLLGMLLTLQKGTAVIYENGHRLEKIESGSYEEVFQVRIEGEGEERLYVQIPEKETQEQIEETPDTDGDTKGTQQKLKEMLDQYNQERNDPDYYYLPQEWDGKHLEWEKPADHTGNFLSALSVFAAFVLLVKKAREQQEAQMRRMEELLMDYPGLIMKFTLLVQAGMTVRKAFQKIGVDYQRKKMLKKRVAYEEILMACHEMDSGVSETEAYRRFGERCGQIKYKTFATLLIQNLQKGSKRMSEMLEKESMEAWDERKRKAHVLGEAAATKLLIPMVLMLLVVMAVVMIPAFLSFYG